MNKVRDCDPTAAGDAESLHWLSSTLDQDSRHLRTDAPASPNLLENMLSPRRGLSGLAERKKVLEVGS